MIELPHPIARYFAAERTAGTDDLEEIFRADAVVHDEGRSHRGLAAIKAWKARAKAATAYTVEPLTWVERDGVDVVSGKVAGSFPGSPVVLEFTFTRDGDRVTRLSIS